MKRIFVNGLGAVSPAGWSVPALCNALRAKTPLPTISMARPGWDKPFQVRPVPAPSVRPPFLAHPRLRRSSALAQHVVAAGTEAVGKDMELIQKGQLRLGIVLCLMHGCVTYSRRFYEEVMNDPSGASPVIFPETVFNAPASHLAAYFNSTGLTSSIVGDEGTFLQGIALGAGWLWDDQVDACLIVGAEELDWVVADAMRLFNREAIQTGGSGALYLRADDSSENAPELTCVTNPVPFSGKGGRAKAARDVRAQLPACGSRELLCLGTQGWARQDAGELAAWSDWNGERMAPKTLLGNAFTASAAWQCVAACESLMRGDYDAANISVVGTNQQAIGTRFAAGKGFFPLAPA